MTSPEPSFFERLVLAWSCLFRVLFDAGFARRVSELRSGVAELPAAPPKKEPAMAVSASIPAPSVKPTASAGDGALQLLALLQREGRFVDFVQQDITAFADADVGAAARVVHQGCQKALGNLGQVSAIRGEPEGSKVTLDPNFDHDAVRLVGNVQGAGPYHGVLRHKGWRVADITLPQLIGNHDARVLAPAEVEL